MNYLTKEHKKELSAQLKWSETHRNNLTDQFTELTKSEIGEINKHQNKIRTMLRAQEREYQETWEFEHRFGYCKHCFSLIPLTGVCDCQ